MIVINLFEITRGKSAIGGKMFKIVLTSAAAVIAMIATPSFAATVIDQSQTGHNQGFSFLAARFPLTSQSFTASYNNSVGGGILISNDPMFTQSGWVTLSLYDAVPTSGVAALAAGSVAAAGGSWADVFWNMVSLNIGQTYWLAARANTDLVVQGNSPNTYSGGSAYYGSTPLPYGDYDLAFRTYSDNAVATAVPEPATWAMIVIGFGAVGASIRRRKQVARIKFA